MPYSIIGNNCRVFHGAVLGEIPQDLKFNEEKSHLIIGNFTTIREYCTINRGTNVTGKTQIGDHCLLMAYVHIAHDCKIGDHSILANSVQVGGHVEIGNYVTVGGMTPIHQFCRVGDYSFTGGGFRIVQDVPPYILAMNEPLQYSGLNIIGLRRQNFSAELRKKLKSAYQFIYQSSLNITQATKKIEKEFNPDPEIQNILKFIEKSTRGII
jgi:UDP-N-acetylglucosamine acyltransferase